MTVTKITARLANSRFETEEQDFKPIKIIQVNKSPLEQNFKNLHWGKTNIEIGNNDTNISTAISYAVDEKGNDVPNKTNFYKHLKTYPFVDSWIKIVHCLPKPNIFRPMLMKIAYSDPFKSYALIIDEFLDKKLLILDTIIPQAQTLRIRDIRNAILDEPIRESFSETNRYINNLIEAGDRRILKFSRRTVYNFRRMRSEHLNTSGRPLIRSHLDSFLKPLNIRMMNYINEHYVAKELPVSYVTIGPQSNELSSTVRIINLGLFHAKPTLRQKLSELRNAPSEMMNYVAAIYQRSKQNRGEGRVVVVIASLDTIRALV